MKTRSGKMRNMLDLKRRHAVVYEVVVSAPEEHGAPARYIREHCRRADWSQERRREWITSGMSRFSTEGITVYAFADQQDAMMFKLGGFG